MTREEAKEMLPIIKAFAEGKDIQRYYGGEWITVNELIFNESPHICRIKPEPKYRPFKNQEECWNEMLKHQPFGWIKNNVGNIFNIIAICKDSIRVNEHSMSYSEFCERFTFIDGTPFGIKEDI